MRSVFSIAAIALLAGCATPAMGSGLAFCLSSPESNQRNLTHLRGHWGRVLPFANQAPNRARATSRHWERVP
jgi:hypothetical protein